MRVVLALLTLAFAVASAPAIAAPALSYDDARHLLNRAGFGATQDDIEQLFGLSREEAARALLAESRTTALNPPPAWTIEAGRLRYPRRADNASEMDKKLFQQEQIRAGLELRGWWLTEMLTTPSPLTERMTLFWHNHFASSQQKVKLAQLMYRQNVTLRANALGNFGELLHAIARDPAMVIYLDSAQNRKGAPNENFAREVMELFTLGEGHYTEQDVKEAARAFTGWSLDRDNGQFMFRRFVHDDGIKTVLGRTGRLDGDQVLDILLAQRAAAEFITRKLWREFISPDPDEREVKRIAQRFRDAHYDIKTALYALFTSDAFYAKENRASLVKSPIDLVVGTLRQFGLRPSEPVPFAVAAAGMGQNLFSPPNVKGWPGGDAWINTSTLLARKQFLDRVLRADDPFAALQAASTEASAMSAPPKQIVASLGVQDPDKARQLRFLRALERGLKSVQFNADAWFANITRSTDPATRLSAATRALLATEPQQPTELNNESLALVRHLVLDASYQLK